MTKDLHTIAVQYLRQAAELVRELPDGRNAATPENKADRNSAGSPFAGPGEPAPGYNACSSLVPGTTIGKHLRHILDHFRLLYAFSPKATVVQRSEGTQWTINYDDRCQSEVDHDPSAALAEISRLEGIIQAHLLEPLSTPVTLLATADSGEKDALSFESTYGRELWFCCLHAVHHYALIKAICVELGVPTAVDFGVAPSTLQRKYCHQSV